MKTNTDSITIGRCPTLTFAILQLVREREVRESKRRAFWSGLKKLLTPWKK